MRRSIAFASLLFAVLCPSAAMADGVRWGDSLKIPLPSPKDFEEGDKGYQAALGALPHEWRDANQ